MEEASSPTDISSSLSDFIRKEKILKELYKEDPYHEKACNDKEIDNILQQMGKLLSPAGESDNKVYKQIIDETEKRSIEDILKEAKGLITRTCDSSISDKAFSSTSSDDLSNGSSNINLDLNGNDRYTSSDEELLTQIEVGKEFRDGERLKNGYQIKKFLSPKKEKFKSPRKNNMNKANYQNSSKAKETIKHQNTTEQEILINQNNMHKLQQVKILSNEVDRINRLYTSCKEESQSLKREMKILQQEWQRKEKQLLEENQKLSQRVSTNTVSFEELELLRSKLSTDNEIITSLERKFGKAMDEWKKKESKLIEERNHLRYKLQNNSRTAIPDVEKLHEQLKDAQETNVKLRLDMDSYKDKCVAMENLCGDLKKIMMDEDIVERVYANDNVPSSVKQFLSSSSSSVLNTLSQMFGCLSRNSYKNRYSNQKNKPMKTQLFTTNESLMMNDLSKMSDYNDLISELIKEKEKFKKENMDLNRQVKELEKIVHKRSHPNFSHLSEIIHNDDKSKSYEKENDTIKNLKKELIENRCIINDYQNQMVELRAKYEQNLRNMQANISNTREESGQKKEEQEKRRVSSVSIRDTRCKRKGRSCDPVISNRCNYRVELTAKDREIQQLHKQLEDLKKTNKKLGHDKENCYSSSKELSADSIKIETDEHELTAVAGQSKCKQCELLNE